MQKTALARYRARTKMLLIMRLIALFLIVGLGAVQARGISQNVTLSGKNISLETVFDAIKKQTGYVTFGTEGLLVKARPVTIEAKNMPLTEFLKLTFSNQALDFEITGKTIVVSEKPAKPDVNFSGEKENALFAEFFPVKGRITDNNGAAMAGATITVKNKNISAVTDSEGQFTIEAQTGDVLLVSFVGFETASYKVSSRNAAVNLSLKAKNTEETELVVTTGYQKIPRERATGAYDVISRNLIGKRPVSNISTALQGLVAGMQAFEGLDGSSSFMIRGLGTFTGNANVLVVVDGFPINGSDFNNINPNDVESVTVLKDAAAASIWGARSGNGVIVITTKQGKRGANRAVNIEGNGFVQVSDRMDLKQVLSQAETPIHIKYEKLAYQKEYFSGPIYNRVFTDISKPLTLAGEFILANRYGQISAEQMNKSLDSLSMISNRDQLQDLLMRRGILSQANVSLSGATEKSKTYTSILYENRKEGFKFRGYDRLLLNFNNQFQPVSFLTFNLGANLQYKKANQSGADVAELQKLSPYETLVNPDGSYSVNLNTWNREQQSLLPLAKFPYQDWSYNLLREVRGREVTQEDLNIRLQASVNIQLLKGLNWDTRIQYERNTINNSNYQSEETFFARDIVNTMTEYTPSTQVVGKQYIPKGGILRARDRKTEGYVFRSQLSWDRDLGSKHHLTALAGTEITRNLATGMTDPWLYGYFPDKNQTTVPPYGYGSTVDQFKNFMGFTAALNGGNAVPTWEMDKFVSFYSNASYTYNNKYTLTTSVRSDASNYITDDPSLRWSPFWSVGGMWHLSREQFMAQAHFVDRLSLRLTHGRNGNADKTTSTKPLLSIETSPNINTGTIIGSVVDFGNPLLRWEKAVTTNLGFDFALFGNRLSGKLDLYNKEGKDIVGLVQLPGATGTTNQRFNNAVISNRGIEVQLGTNLSIGKDFSYTPIITYAFNKNRVTKLYYPNVTVQNLISGEYQVLDKPLGAVYSYTYLGMKDSVPYFAGVKGEATSFNTSTITNKLGLDILNYEGSVIQPHTLGMVNNFRYRQFNLMVVLLGKFGGVFRDPMLSYRLTQAVGTFKTNVNQVTGEIFAGNPNIPDFPKYRESNFNSWDQYMPYLNGLVESASYLELKEVNLEYNLPAKVNRKIRTEAAKLFVQSRNLGLLWRANNNGYHPEWLPGQNRPVTSFTAGLNIKF